MNDYISNTLDRLKSGKYSELTIVLGNESCDLDSAISSIVYAAFLYWHHMKLQCTVCTRKHREDENHLDALFVPVLNVIREDFPLKTEVVYCLKESGIDESKLVFRDDYDLNTLLTTTKTKIVIVDHHVLSKKDQFLSSYVTEIIDHRPLDKTNWTYKNDTRSTIEVVASCCTLITQRVKDVSILIANDTEFFIGYPTCADLLYSTILLDSGNFSKDLNKATMHDREIVSFLEAILKPPDVENFRITRYHKILRARADVSHLTSAQLLRKDLKVFGDIMVPGFPILIEEFLQKPGAKEAIIAALEIHNCSMALLLGMTSGERYERDVAIYPAPSDNAKQLSEFLVQWSNPSFRLELKMLPFTSGFIYFKQNKRSASRKHYMAALQYFNTAENER